MRSEDWSRKHNEIVALRDLLADADRAIEAIENGTSWSLRTGEPAASVAMRARMDLGRTIQAVELLLAEVTGRVAVSDVPTWQAFRSSGEPGQADGQPFEIGVPERLAVVERRGGPPVPDDAPGRRVESEHTVSAIFVPVEVDESGAEEHGDEIWRYQAWVRVATDEEAAPLLAGEAATRRRGDLRRRVADLLTKRRDTADATGVRLEDVPPTATLVPVGDYHDTSPADRPGATGLETTYWVDRVSRTVWTLPAHVPTVWAMPLTPERERLVVDLEAEYDVPALTKMLRTAADLLRRQGPRLSGVAHVDPGAFTDLARQVDIVTAALQESRTVSPASARFCEGMVHEVSDLAHRLPNAHRHDTEKAGRLMTAAAVIAQRITHRT